MLERNGSSPRGRIRQDGRQTRPVGDHHKYTVQPPPSSEHAQSPTRGHLRQRDHQKHAESIEKAVVDVLEQIETWKR